MGADMLFSVDWALVRISANAVDVFCFVATEATMLDIVGTFASLAAAIHTFQPMQGKACKSFWKWLIANTANFVFVEYIVHIPSFPASA